MNSDLYLELLTRVISLEKAVKELQEKQELSDEPGTKIQDEALDKIHPESKPEKETESEKKDKKIPTRKKAILDLSEKISDRSLNVELFGSGNRGSNRLRVKNSKGTRGVYLSTSKNYATEPYEPFASWHTIDIKDAHNEEEFGFFIFSPEDENGNPLYFVLTFEDLQKKIRDKKPVPTTREDGILEYYHFALSRKYGRDSEEFIDFRKGEESDFTEYYNALEKLEG